MSVFQAAQQRQYIWLHWWVHSLSVVIILLLFMRRHDMETLTVLLALWDKIHRWLVDSVQIFLFTIWTRGGRYWDPSVFIELCGHTIRKNMWITDLRRKVMVVDEYNCSIHSRWTTPGPAQTTAVPAVSGPRLGHYVTAGAGQTRRAQRNLVLGRSDDGHQCLPAWGSHRLSSSLTKWLQTRIYGELHCFPCWLSWHGSAYRITGNKASNCALLTFCVLRGSPSHKGPISCNSGVIFILLLAPLRWQSSGMWFETPLNVAIMPIGHEVTMFSNVCRKSVGLCFGREASPWSIRITRQTAQNTPVC